MKDLWSKKLKQGRKGYLKNEGIAKLSQQKMEYLVHVKFKITEKRNLE